MKVSEVGGYNFYKSVKYLMLYFTDL